MSKEHCIFEEFDGSCCFGGGECTYCNKISCDLYEPICKNAFEDGEEKKERDENE